MQILVDTSIWIDFFKKGEKSLKLDDLLVDDRVVINDIILAELIPVLHLKKQFTIIDLLKNVVFYPLAIDWNQIIEWQTMCLNSGINGIGIPDLLITQNAVQNNFPVYSLDKHFRTLSKISGLQLFE
ncbi:PIN domain-containing protein [Methyloglobulus sp.]|uniref:PIN domain-containing protein n=1 Tax=Methyloglobulus sp. TaxID=2518622 RepID=UPI0017DA2259|nr:PIN domain-containing protein [Methyloglobulus sp.]